MIPNLVRVQTFKSKTKLDSRKTEWQTLKIKCSNSSRLFFFYLLVQKEFNSKVHISTIFIEAILEIK